MGGPFSSKKVTSVGTSASPLVPRDEEIENFNKYSVFRYIMGNTDLTSELLDGFMESPYFKIRKGLRYAQKKYVYGIPKFSYVSPTTVKGMVMNIIEGELGHDVTPIYYKVKDWNLHHRTWEILQNQYEWDSYTNRIGKISAQVGYSCYLKDFSVVYSSQTWETKNQDDLGHWGPKPTYGRTHSRPYNKTGDATNMTGATTPHEIIEGRVATVEYDEAGDTDDPHATLPRVAEKAIVTYEYKTSWKGSTRTGTFEIDFGHLSAWEGGVVQVGYKWKRERREEYQDTDQRGEPVTKTRSWTEHYYGFWSYPLNGTIPQIDQALEEGISLETEIFPIIPYRMYRESTRSRLGKDSEALKSVKKLVDKMGMDWDYIHDEIHKNEDVKYVEQGVQMFAARMNGGKFLERKYVYAFIERCFFQNEDSSTDGVVVQIKQHDFDMTLSFSYIRREVIVGKLGAKGTYHRFDDSETYTVTKRKHVGNNEYEVTKETKSRVVPGIAYQKSNNVYIVYYMGQPKMTFNIWGGHKEIANFEDPHFLVPVDNHLLDSLDYSIMERNEMYLRTGHFVFNARKTEKVKWYERGVFKFVLTVAAIALFVFSGFQAWQALALAATMGALALAWTITMMIVKAIVFKYGFKFVADLLGEEWAWFLAIAAATIGGFKAFQHGSVQGAPWASELLGISSGLANGASYYYQSKIEDLQVDAKKFMEEIEAKEKELERGEDLLEQNTHWSPEEFLNSIYDAFPGESADFFYNRTVHAGNIGVLALDIPHQYVDNVLRLPDPTTPLTV